MTEQRDPPRSCPLGIALSQTGLAKAHRTICAALGGPTLDPTTFDRSAHAPETLKAAGGFWQARMEAEHRSVAVFLLLGAQLIEANAPLDAKTVMLGMAQDELRHTEICGLVVRALGEEPVALVDPSCAPLARHAGCSREERALRNVLYTTCLSEMVAVGRLVDALEATTDPLVRAATRAVLTDEVMHGQYGFLYLDACRGWLDEQPAVRDSLVTYLRHAFAVLEHEMVHGLAQARRPTPGACRLGVIDPHRARDVFYGTVEAAIVPGLEARGLAAGAAWRQRARVNEA
jgi:hypothetical protein